MPNRRSISSSIAPPDGFELPGGVHFLVEERGFPQALRFGLCHQSVERSDFDSRVLWACYFVALP